MLFGSAVVWAILAISIWFAFGDNLATISGLPPRPQGMAAPIGLGYFFTNESKLFYSYYLACILIFSGFWHFVARRHAWKAWSIWGSAYLIFFTYFSVDISIALTYWRGPFYDLIVKAVSKPGEMLVTQSELYWNTIIFFELASIYITFAVLTTFITSHYLFRWRNAMTDHYYAEWAKVRHIEGASQRIQEDTMRFSTTVEDLGTRLIDSLMTLIAYLPLLTILSANVKELPLVGAIPYPLVTAAIFWSVFGTLLMIVAGVKLPGLEFQNQRVEAAFRKELVYGEDHFERAQPVGVKELFSNIRKNRFRMFGHYIYFNFFRYLYIQTDSIFPIIIMVPTISAAAITFGLFQQIRDAFSQVTNSFQYLVNSWPTMIELISIYKRLQAFEAAMHDQPLPTLDQEFVESGGKEDL